MKTNTLIEIGSISDLDGNCYDAFASHLTFTGRGEDLDVVVENITLELQSTDGQLLTTLYCPSLSEMPDRFSQRQVNALEASILEDKRVSDIAYENDRYWDMKREDV